MAGVMIDIPGVGPVEAKNAATEATLKEILKALKGQSTGGGAPSAGGGGASGGAGGAGGGAGGAGFFTKAAGGAGKAIYGVGKAAGMVAGGLGKIATGAGFVVGKMANLAEQGFATADKLAKMGNSAEDAADIFAGIPILGTVFKAVASAADKMVAAYTTAAASGATFGGSISQFAASASAAGMNLKEFGDLIRSNGVGMLGFGATTEEGATRFAQVSKSLRTTASDLYALGYTTADINGGLAKYGQLLKLQGQQGGKTNAELAAGAKRYLTEMDMLAKITGEERSAKEEQMKQLATDAQFRMFLAGKDEKVGEDFRNMIGSFGPKLGGFVKDYMATGTLTTEANQKLAAMLGGDVMNEMSRLRQKLVNNQRLTDEEQDRLKSIMKKAADANSKNAGAALAASRDMDDASAGLIEAMGLEENAHKKARDSQAKSAKSGDGFNEKMQKMQQTLSQIGNTFTELLASSGFLDLMMSGVQLVASLLTNVFAPAMKALDAVLRPGIEFLQKILVPAFAVLSAIVEKIAFGFQLILAPVVEQISKALGSVTGKFSDFEGAINLVDEALNWLFEIADSTVKAVGTAFSGLWEAVEGLMQPLSDLWSAVTDLFGTSTELYGNFEWLSTTILEVGQVVGDAFKILGAIIGSVINVATDVVKWFTNVILKSEMVSNYFKTLGEVVSSVWQTFRKYFSVDGLKAVFEDITEGFSSIIDTILHLIPNAMGGMSDEVYKQRQEEREARKKARDEALEAAKAEKDLKIAAQKAEVQEDKKKFAEKKVYVDANKKLTDRELSSKEAAAKAAEKAASIDYNSGPEALLKQFAEHEKSPLAQKSASAAPQVQAKEAAKTAEATKKELESKGEEKAAADRKALQEAEAKKAAELKTKEEGAKPTPAQETAETLLAQLNSNMAQLIRISQEQKEIGERQLSVQKGLTGNLFASV